MPTFAALALVSMV
jgi:hypothetical protein